MRKYIIVVLNGIHQQYCVVLFWLCRQRSNLCACANILQILVQITINLIHYYALHSFAVTVRALM